MGEWHEPKLTVSGLELDAVRRDGSDATRGDGGVRPMIRSHDLAFRAALAETMRRAGAVVTKEPEDAEFFEGRSCYLRDPEGNFWEIAWAPESNAIVAAARRAAARSR